MYGGVEEVRSGAYPQKEHTYPMSQEELDEFVASTKEPEKTKTKIEE